MTAEILFYYCSLCCNKGANNTYICSYCGTPLNYKEIYEYTQKLQHENDLKMRKGTKSPYPPPRTKYIRYRKSVSRTIRGC